MERLIKNGERSGVSKPATNRGFTLIELMIVMTLIGILAAIAQPQFQQYTIRAREAVLKENLFTLRDVIDQYYGDKGKYPDNLQELVDNRYIRKVPEDPFTKSAETWITVPPDDGEGSIFDVHSGSDLIALNGTPYNEW
ncbi:MAG: type II secretion system protein G [Deltaproteobacteria bacterium]|nr:type II secretion system protein G [Deltaproteobacteria bacterium]MBM2837817.1 type secretion system protein [Deltaproteobacteria bacterium]